MTRSVGLRKQSTQKKSHPKKNSDFPHRVPVEGHHSVPLVPKRLRKTCRREPFGPLRYIFRMSLVVSFEGGLEDNQELKLRPLYIYIAFIYIYMCVCDLLDM